MSSPTTPAAGRAVADRASNEFARVVNLSDAVFAIAMTLLVLTVDVPDVDSSGLAAALLADLPQLGAYALAFVLVASQWYAHRKLFQRLASTEVGLTIINLAFLGLCWPSVRTPPYWPLGSPWPSGSPPSPSPW